MAEASREHDRCVARVPIFAGLSEGGAKITMPIGETFWSPRFGMLIDRFGTNWMVGADMPADQANCG